MPLHLRELPSDQRPRERLRALGPRALSTVELLTLLLGSGPRGSSAADVAHALLARHEGSLRRLGLAPLAALTHQHGVGPARAAVVAAALELGRRLAGEARDVGRPLHQPQDVYAYYGPRLADLPVEEFHVAVLDAQHRLERDVLVSHGLLDMALVHPREVFREAIAERAAAVILVHNHPSGDPTPSADDRRATQQLVSAGRLLDIPVHDHVVIGRGGFVSFAMQGWLG